MLKVIGHIECDFKEKFGIPRQAGLAEGCHARIVFEPEYARPEAFRGLEEYSHIWIIWQFSEAIRENPSLTVRPPRLGGNKRMGVFATRSPFRPNALGLSSVRLLGIEEREGKVSLTVSGADLMDGTPIYDIKPYLSYTDSHPEAKCGFADRVLDYKLEVYIPREIEDRIPENLRGGLREILEQDPRPSYIEDGERVYTFSYSDFEISFTVLDTSLTVCGIEKSKP